MKGARFVRVSAASNATDTNAESGAMSHQSNSAAGVPRQRVTQPSAAADGGVDATSTPQSTSLDVEATGQTKGYNRFLRLVADAVKFRRRKIAVNTEDDGRIPWSVKLPYAFPQFSLTSLTMLIGIHGTIFYTKIGADVAFIAFFTALARSFDVVTDPVMGYVSDKTRTKWGRRRPYMFGACLFYALCFIMLFSPPKTDSSSGVAIWFGIFYIIFYLFDTIGNVPYSALGPELSDVASERDSLFFWAKLFNGIGILVGAVGPVGLAVALRGSTAECTCEQTCPFGADGAAAEGVNWNATAWGNYPTAYYNASSCSESSIETLPSQLHTWCTCYNDCDAECDVAVSRTSFQTIAIVFGVYYVSSMLLCVWKVKERKFGQLSNEEAAPLVPSLLATLRNKPFMGLLPAWVCDMTAYTMIGTMLPFFVEYVIVPSSVPECADGKRAAFGMDPVAEDQESEQWCKSETWLGMGLVALIGAQIVAMPVWLKLTKIFGKFKTWLAFNLTTAVTNGLFVIIGQGDPKLTIMLAVLNGMPSGAQFLTDSIVADVIDYDEFLTGERAEGRFTIFQTFIPKIVSVPAQAVPLALLSFFGFVAPVKGVTQDQPARVKMFIQFVFFILPCALALISFAIKTKFPIRSEQTSADIVKGAALHLKGEVAKDPLTGKYVGLFHHRSEAEKRETWRLDNFFKSQLKLLVDLGPEEGGKRLVAQLWRTFMTCIAFSTVAFIVTASSIAGGLLSNESWSWLPAFAVIAFGMGVSAVVFNWVRYKAAVSLRDQPVATELVERWYKHLIGTEDAPADSLLAYASRHEKMVKTTSAHSMRNSSDGAGAGAPGGDDVTPQAVMLPNHVDDGTSG